MDDLLREFLTETGEHLETVDAELVRFERHPDDQAILRNIFRLVHTIKGTCGFLGLPRLETLAHAAETLMGRLRDGMPVTSDAVTLILATVDRIKLILAGLEQASAEPAGSDADVIAALDLASQSLDGVLHDGGGQMLLRPLRAGEVSLEELERAFQGTPGPAPSRPADVATPSPPEPGEGPAARAQTIRVSIDTLETLMTMVSELVLTRNQLLDLSRKSGGEGGFQAPLQRLSHVTAELQDGIMRTRMQPIGSAWAKLPRLVRDLGPELGKEIDLVMHGAETELDRQLLEIIRDPLTHMVRNAADHGLEMPQRRLAAGKPAKGTIRLNAFHEGGTITIEISDDGRGLDHAAIRRRAAACGLAPEADLERMSDDQVARYIFHPGFSTSASVSAVSGRGVGMDVVRSNIGLIGGTVEIASQTGRGTAFTVKIPLTLAIIAALIVEIGGRRFALPQVAVVELVRVRPGSDHVLERIDSTAVLRLREQLLPVVMAGDLLRLPARPGNEGFVVVTQVGRQRFGILVDGVLETEEIVVKPMCSALRHIPLYAGNTVLGDGAVVLILDPNGIARQVGSEAMRGIADLATREEVAGQEAERVTLLVFRARDGVFKAVPLSLITRLVEVDAASIERVGGQSTIQYRGRLMPLVAPDGLATGGRQAVIVVGDGERTMGLCVAEIVDVVETVLEIEPAIDRPDLVGAAIVRGRATEIVDLARLLPWGGAGPAPERPGAPALLLVDDNPFFREMLAPVLKAAGYRVLKAAGREDALRIAASVDLAAVVADLDLPGGGGLDLVERLRRDPRHRNTVAIGLSSGAGEAALRRARALDVFDVISKFDRPGLLAALAEAADAREAGAGALGATEMAA